MNHDHTTMVSSPITEMEIMWVLMFAMLAWNLLMAYQHKKLKKKVECHCGTYPCVKCESGSH